MLEKEKAEKLLAVHCHGVRCSVCGQQLGGRVRSVVFSCRHGFHIECVDRCGGVRLSPAGDEVWSCVECKPTHPKATGRRVIVNGVGLTESVQNETLDKSISCWRRYSEPVNYAQDLSYDDKEEAGFTEPDSFLASD